MQGGYALLPQGPHRRPSPPCLPAPPPLPSEGKGRRSLPQRRWGGAGGEQMRSQIPSLPPPHTSPSAHISPHFSEKVAEGGEGADLFLPPLPLASLPVSAPPSLFLPPTPHSPHGSRGASARGTTSPPRTLLSPTCLPPSFTPCPLCLPLLALPPSLDLLASPPTLPVPLWAGAPSTTPPSGRPRERGGGGGATI